MDEDLVALETADGSGRMWVVPDRIKVIDPSPLAPAEWSLVTMTSGHAWTFVGKIEEIKAKVKRAEDRR